MSSLEEAPPSPEVEIKPVARETVPEEEVTPVLVNKKSSGKKRYAHNAC